MPETAEFSAFSNTQNVAETLKQDTSWSEGKQIETYEYKVGVHDHIKQDKLDPYLLLDALENAKDAWDENGNLVKVADYRDPKNGKEGHAVEAIIEIRQVTYQKELEKAYRGVEKAEQKSGHLVTLSKGKTVVLGSDPAVFDSEHPASQQNPAVKIAANANKLKQIVESKEPKILAAAALELKYDNNGQVSFRTLAREEQVTVSYKSKTDGGLHFITLPQEVGGSMSPDQVEEFNRDAEPGNTKLYVIDRNGNGILFSEYNVVVGKSFTELATGKAGSIKEISWRWQEIKPNVPVREDLEDIVILGGPMEEEEPTLKIPPIKMETGQTYKVGSETVASLPYENAFSIRVRENGTVLLMSGQEDCYGLAFYRQFEEDGWEPAFTLENRQSGEPRIKAFQKAQGEMNKNGDLRTLRIEIGKNGQRATHQVTLSGFPRGYGKDSKNLTELTMAIEEIPPGQN